MLHTINSHRAASIAILAALLCACLLPGIPAFAQQPAVQEIQGGINPGEIDVFRLSGLQRGQTVYISMQTTSGNLDPALAIVPGNTDLVKLRADYTAELQQLVQTAQHPLAELPGLRDRYFLAWDDDSGPGYAAALVFPVPQDGDYILIASGSLSAAGRSTSGRYRLILGVDAPEVLSREAVPTGTTIATPDDSLLGLHPRIQEVAGSLDSNTPTTAFNLYGLESRGCPLCGGTGYQRRFAADPGAARLRRQTGAPGQPARQ